MRLKRQIIRELVFPLLLVRLYVTGKLASHRGAIVIIIRGVINPALRIIAVIDCLSFLMMGIRPDWLPITSWVLSSHTFLSHVRHYLLIRGTIFNSFVGKYMSYCSLLNRRLWFVSATYEANHIFLGIRKPQIILNGFSFNIYFITFVRSEGSFKFSWATLVTSLAGCLDSVIVQFRMIY